MKKNTRIRNPIQEMKQLLALSLYMPEFLNLLTKTTKIKKPKLKTPKKRKYNKTDIQTKERIRTTQIFDFQF